MRRIWILLLAFGLLFSLCACKKDSENNKTSATESTPTTEEQKPTDPPSVKDYLTEDAVAVIPEKDDIAAIPDVKVPEKVERGNQIGDYCVSGKLEIVDAQGGTGSFIDPAATGRITVITFWGTWCAPSLQDLTAVDQIAREMGEDAAVIAIHSSINADAVPAFIGESYPDSPIIFTWDETVESQDAYYTALGGAGSYPMTVVLNPHGVIVDVFSSSVTYKQLRELMETANVQ